MLTSNLVVLQMGLVCLSVNETSCNNQSVIIKPDTKTDMGSDQKAIKTNFFEDKFYRKLTKSGYRNPRYDQFMKKVDRICLLFFILLLAGLFVLCIGNAIGVPFIQEWVLQVL